MGAINKRQHVRHVGGTFCLTPLMTLLLLLLCCCFSCLVAPALCRSKHRRHVLPDQSTHDAGDLIGWRGEVHKVESVLPEYGKPFVFSDYWAREVNQPLGSDQWVAWYHGFTGDSMEGPEQVELLRQREKHNGQQLTQPCMSLSKFVDAGLASRDWDEQRTSQRDSIESVRAFPHSDLIEASRNDADIPRYAHMATLARNPQNGSVALAFQASPSIEGGDGQRIWIAFSKDAKAKEWWPPSPVPIKQGGTQFRSPEGKFVTAAQWGPVLHEDQSGQLGKLWLFFSESGGDCHEPANPEEGHDGRWVVGGDIKATCLLEEGVEEANGNGDTWEEPRSIHSMSEGKIPKITANGALVHSSGSWILPFWRQKPRHIFITNQHTNRTTRRCEGPKRRTTASVLISHDRGETWKASGKLAQRSAGWLIENTLVELTDTSLWMLFRTKAGAVFSCKSTDGGQSWSTASVIEELVNTDSKIHVIRLRDGRLLLAYNDHPRPFVQDFVKNELVASRERTRLLISVSDDEGETWKKVTRIDRPAPEDSSSDFDNAGAQSPFELRQMDEASPLSVQYHYPYLLELAPNQDDSDAGNCKAIVAYTKSKLNVVSQKTSGHEIWVSCIPGL